MSESAAQPVIEARGLTRRYGGRAAVESLDLSIERGTVFGLLGPNGAGKTTTILMIMGLTEITAGTVRVLGLDPARQPLQVKRQVGYMPDTVGFYDQLTARQNLAFTGRLAGVARSALGARIDAALARVGLAEVADRRVATFSRGMRQRLGLADVLLKQPQVAILDEPTTGLDPQATHELLDLIRQLKAEGITVLLSSHLLDRVQAVCDRVGLFHRGRLVLEGTVEELAHRMLGTRYRIEVTARAADVAGLLAAAPGVARVEPAGADSYTVYADEDVGPALVRRIAGAGGEVVGLARRAPSLDEIYTRYFSEVGHAA